MDRIIDIEAYPVNLVLSKLLKDKTTKQNIIFGTDKYEYNGKNVLPTDQITTKMLLSKGRIEIQPRVSKTIEEQSERTKEKAE